MSGTNVAKGEKSYNLIWSPGFISSYLRSALCLLALVFAVHRIESLNDTVADLQDWLQARAVTTAQRYAFWSAASLLSSSCCALQLALNAFSLGCAGFNTILGPWRPVFLAVSTAGQILMWRALQLESQVTQAIIASTLFVVLAFLPEALWVVNLRNAKKAAAAIASTATAAATPGTRTSRSTMLIPCSVRIESMGCVACVNTIQQVIKDTPGVLSPNVSLEQSTANFVVVKEQSQDSNDVDNIATLVCKRLGQSGFPATRVPPSQEAAHLNHTATTEKRDKKTR